jgi:hypothetical protein
LDDYFCCIDNVGSDISLSSNIAYKTIARECNYSAYTYCIRHYYSMIREISLTILLMLNHLILCNIDVILSIISLSDSLKEHMLNN